MPRPRPRGIPPPILPRGRGRPPPMIKPRGMAPRPPPPRLIPRGNMNERPPPRRKQIQPKQTTNPPTTTPTKPKTTKQNKQNLPPPSSSSKKNKNETPTTTTKPKKQPPSKKKKDRYHPASAASVARIRELFATVDTDESGTIEASELLELIKSLNIEYPKITNGLVLPNNESDANQIMDSLDLDHNGNLDEEEFIVWVRKGLKQTKMERIKEQEKHGLEEKIENFMFTIASILRKGALHDLFQHFETDSTSKTNKSIDSKQLGEMIQLTMPTIDNNVLQKILYATMKDIRNRNNDSDDDGGGDNTI